MYTWSPQMRWILLWDAYFTEKLIVVNFWKYFIDLYVTFGFDKAAFLLDNCHPFKCQWQRMTGIHQTAHNNNKRYSRTAHSDDAPFNTTIISLPERHLKKNQNWIISLKCIGILQENWYLKSRSKYLWHHLIFEHKIEFH